LAQAIEHLLCKHEALSLSPSSIKKKKRKKRKGSRKWDRGCIIPALGRLK
jgi:hypothetical protein